MWEDALPWFTNPQYRLGGDSGYTVMINQPSGHTVWCGRINYHGYPNLWTELMVWEATMFWLTNPLDRLGGVRMHCHDPPTLWTDLVVWEDALAPLTSSSPFHHSHNVFLPILEHISVILLTDGMAHSDSCVMHSTVVIEWMTTDDVHLMHKIIHFHTFKISCMFVLSIKNLF